MSAADIRVTGNALADPELRITADGTALCRVRVAATERKRTAAGGWEDGETLFIDVTAWRDLGEHVAASVTKGTRLVVEGRLRQRSYETAEGEKRTAYEIDAAEVSVSLRFAEAQVRKITREAAEPAGRRVKVA